MIAEHKCWHHRVSIVKTRRMIYVRRYDIRCLGKVKIHVDVRSRSGHGWPATYLDLRWSCCISMDLEAHAEHIGAFPDALAQFGRGLLTKN